MCNEKHHYNLINIYCNIFNIKGIIVLNSLIKFMSKTNIPEIIKAFHLFDHTFEKLAMQIDVLNE